MRACVQVVHMRFLPEVLKVVKLTWVALLTLDYVPPPIIHESMKSE